MMLAAWGQVAAGMRYTLITASNIKCSEMSEKVVLKQKQAACLNRAVQSPPQSQ